MKATVEEINSVQRRLKITVPAEVVNKAFDSAYLKFQKKAKIQGFRPGKAPVHLIKKMYKTNVSYEVGEKLIQENLWDAIKNQEVKPVASPFVEVETSPEMDKDYHFSAVLDVMPNIEIKDSYKGLSIKAKDYKATDESLDKELQKLVQKHAKTSPLSDEVEAQKGHLAVISHKASIGDVELTGMDVKSTPVALGKGEIFPELENAILGMKKNSDKKIDITMPQEYGDQELAGKLVHFHISVHDLYDLDIPELNDSFAKDVNYDSLADLKKSIKENLEASAEQMTKQDLEASLLQALISKAPFEVPPAMVDQVIDSMIGDVPFNDEKDRKKALKDEEIRKSLRLEAKRKAQNTIILWEIIKAEDLSVNDQEIKSHIEKFAKDGDNNVEEQVQNT